MSKNSISTSDLQPYQKHYNEDDFFKKLGKFARKAGIKTVYYSLVLYYTLTDPATPSRYKAVIMGALGYFILPLDFIPDLFPGIGMADDWGALVGAVLYVMTAITPEIKLRAQAKLADWFGSYTQNDLGDLA